MPKKAYDENGNPIGDMHTPEEVAEASAASFKKATDEAAAAHAAEIEKLKNPTPPPSAAPVTGAEVAKVVDQQLAASKRADEIERVTGGDAELKKRVEASLKELDGLPESTPAQAAEKVAKAARLAGIGARPRQVIIAGGTPPKASDDEPGMDNWDPELAAQFGVTKDQFKKYGGRVRQVQSFPQINQQDN